MPQSTLDSVRQLRLASMSRKRSREDADLPEDPEQDLPLGTQESSLFELQVRKRCSFTASI